MKFDIVQHLSGTTDDAYCTHTACTSDFIKRNHSKFRVERRGTTFNGLES